MARVNIYIEHVVHMSGLLGRERMIMVYFVFCSPLWLCWFSEGGGLGDGQREQTAQSKRHRGDPWMEHVGPATVLDIEVRELASKHAITMMQVERWLEGASTSPNEGVKKAKLKDLLGSRYRA